MVDNTPQLLHHDLSPPVSDLARIIEQHDKTVALVEQGLTLLEQAVAACPGGWGIQAALDHCRWYTDDIAARNIPAVSMAVRRATWEALLKASRLTTVMSASDVDKLKQDIQGDNPPEITRDNVINTFIGLYDIRHDSFRRGLVELFQTLCRAYRTNKAFKIGKKIIIDNAMTEYGWNSFGRDEARCNDLMRIFLLLDGHDAGNISPDDQLGNQLSKARQTKQETYQNDYFSIRLYLNGNLHVAFLRTDLVDKANRLIADFYGHALPDDSPT